MSVFGWIKSLNWRKARKEKAIKDLKLIRDYNDMSRAIRKAAFDNVRKNCPHKKKTGWSFQKLSCKRSIDTMYNGIGPCLLNKCPIINKETG